MWAEVAAACGNDLLPLQDLLPKVPNALKLVTTTSGELALADARPDPLWEGGGPGGAPFAGHGQAHALCRSPQLSWWAWSLAASEGPWCFVEAGGQGAGVAGSGDTKGSMPAYLRPPITGSGSGAGAGGI